MNDAAETYRLAAAALAVLLGIAVIAALTGRNSLDECESVCGKCKVAVCGREIRCKP